VPIAIENPDQKSLPSATQWTSAIDLTARRIYYKTAYNNSIRCIDLKSIDFATVKYQSHPLDAIQSQPINMIDIK
jgi:choloylglycine hydrolase